MKRKVLLILITTMVVVGCKHQQPVVDVPLKEVYQRVSTLIPFYIPGDSATLQALFECDSLNNVLLKNFTETKGQNVDSELTFNGGSLSYNTKFKPDTVFVPSDTIYREVPIPIRIEVPKVEYKQTGLQNFLSWVGAITLIILLLWGVWKIIKIKFKTF